MKSRTPILYIPAIQKNLNIKLSKSEIKKLPKELFLAYSIQYRELAEYIKKQLEKEKIKVQSFKQVLSFKKQKIFNRSLFYYLKKHHSLISYLIFCALNPVSLFLTWMIQKLLRNKWKYIPTSSG